MVGTPAWFGNESLGNHNWVEVYLPEKRVWKFLEPSPSLPVIDTLESDPCSRWFCEPSRYPSSKVYAARLGNIESDPWLNPRMAHVPLPWEWDCRDVPGIDRTQYYVDVCGVCDH